MARGAGIDDAYVYRAVLTYTSANEEPYVSVLGPYRTAAAARGMLTRWVSRPPYWLRGREVDARIEAAPLKWETVY